ncbi:MAG: DUF3299 domain-containing protein [Bdellovibrionota bacterium]
MKKWIGIGSAIFAVVLGAVLYKVVFQGRHGGVGVEINWRLLGEMDYITAKASSELEALNGKKVKMPGFMVPLEDSMKTVTEFLLVPSPQACIHVPPPPPNQMVYVKMDPSAKTEVPYGPIWVYGTLNLVTKKSMYGDASFELLGDFVEPYK